MWISKAIHNITPSTFGQAVVQVYDPCVLFLFSTCVWWKESLENYQLPGFLQIVSVSEVVQVLQSTRHNGFPVIRHTEPYDEGQLVGLILRHQLLLLLEQRALIEVDSDTLHQSLPRRLIEREPRVTKEHVYLEHAMRVYHHSHYPHKRYLSSFPEALEELELEDILQVGLLLRESPKFYETNLPVS